MIKTYTELIKYFSYEDRLKYLKLNGKVGEDTFGFDRILNQKFYKSKEWNKIRNLIIARDNACDLGLEGYDIFDKILIHHMNPITVEDISEASEFLLNPEYLITVSLASHNYIHYGNEGFPKKDLYDERKPYDTCPWKR